MAERQLPKLIVRVRFSSPAPVNSQVSASSGALAGCQFRASTALRASKSPDRLVCHQAPTSFVRASRAADLRGDGVACAGVEVDVCEAGMPVRMGSLQPLRSDDDYLVGPALCPQRPGSIRWLSAISWSSTVPTPTGSLGSGPPRWDMSSRRSRRDLPPGTTLPRAGVPESELIDGADRISDPDGHGPSI
jgi:hypothetical protein